MLNESDSSIGIIPRKDDLLIYSKYDQETGDIYIKPAFDNYFVMPGDIELVRSFSGPFSIPNSAYRTTSGTILGSHTLVQHFSIRSFTLGVFLRVPGTGINAIYSDNHAMELFGLFMKHRFSVVANDLDVEFHLHDASATTKVEAMRTVANFTFSNVLKANDWQFLALVYDDRDQTLKLFDETANLVQEEANVDIDQVSTRHLYIGAGFYNGVEVNFAPSSAIACLSLHTVALSQMEIALLPCACQFKDKLQTRF